MSNDIPYEVYQYVRKYVFRKNLKVRVIGDVNSEVAMLRLKSKIFNDIIEYLKSVDFDSVYVEAEKLYAEISENSKIFQFLSEFLSEEDMQREKEEFKQEIMRESVKTHIKFFLASVVYVVENDKISTKKSSSTEFIEYFFGPAKKRSKKRRKTKKQKIREQKAIRLKKWLENRLPDNLENRKQDIRKANVVRSKEIPIIVKDEAYESELARKALRRLTGAE